MDEGLSYRELLKDVDGASYALGYIIGMLIAEDMLDDEMREMVGFLEKYILDDSHLVCQNLWPELYARERTAENE
jgi:hypothetical protein